MRAVVLAAALMLLTACGGQSGPLTVDGSSKAAAEKSIADMTAALSDEKKKDFQAAVAMGWPMSELAGKNADDVIALARAKTIKMLQDKTIPDLQAKVSLAQAAIDKATKGQAASKRFLTAISLINPQLVWRPGADGTPSPLFSFNMKNGSSEAIQTIVFQAKIGPKAGGKPWIDQRFSFKFVEAVTTDESSFVFVTPDLSQPGNANALQAQATPPNGYAYSVNFIRVDDLNGRAIMDDEAVTKAQADLRAVKDAVTAAEAELKRLQDGGSITA